MRTDKHTSNNIFVKIYDVMFIGWPNQECWNSACTFTVKYNHIGIQDAHKNRKGKYYRNIPGDDQLFTRQE